MTLTDRDLNRLAEIITSGDYVKIAIPQALEERPEIAVNSTNDWAEDVSQVYKIGPTKFDHIVALDGANAFRRAVANVFGTSAKGLAIPPQMFSPGQPPQLREVPIQNLHYKLPVVLNEKYQKAHQGTEPLYECELEVTEHSLDDLHIADLWNLAQEVGAAIPTLVPDERERNTVNQEIIKKGALARTSEGTMQVPFGLVSIFNDDGSKWGQASLEEDEDDHMFVLTILTKKGRAKTADLLLAEVKRQFSLGSIYRNRIWNWNDSKFVTPNPDAASKLVLNERIVNQKRGQVCNRIKYLGKIKRSFPHLSRANILQVGSWGNGKSHSHEADMWFALQHGWSVIQWMPAKESDRFGFNKLLAFASKLGPTLILVEDFERMLSDDPDDFSNLLNELDGSVNKNLNIITIWTTNHPDKIEPAIWRRFTGVIEFGLPESVEEYKTFLDVKLRDTFAGASENSRYHDYICPAYVIEDVFVDVSDPSKHTFDRVAEIMLKREVPFWLADLAVRSTHAFALNQTSDRMVVTEQNVIDSLEALMPQWERFVNAHEKTTGETIQSSVKNLLVDVLDDFKGQIVTEIEESVK